MEGSADSRRASKLADLNRYIDWQCGSMNSLYSSIGEKFRRKLHNLIQAEDLTSDEIDSLRQEVVIAICALKNREKVAAEEYKVGQELWLSHGPATVSKIYKNNGLTRVAVKYLHGDISGTNMRGNDIPSLEKDREADPELYERDRQYCLAVADKIQELRDKPGSLADFFRSHIKWSDYPEHVSEVKRQLEPLGTTEASIYRKAGSLLRRVINEEPLKTDIIKEIKAALIKARERHLNEKMSLEEIQSQVADELALIVVRNVYRQVLPAFYKKSKKRHKT